MIRNKVRLCVYVVVYIISSKMRDRRAERKEGRKAKGNGRRILLVSE